MTSKFIVILTEFPALTTMKLFILRVVNFGLTKTLKKINERCNRVILKREKEMISGQVLMFEIFDKKKYTQSRHRKIELLSKLSHQSTETL